MIDKYRQAFEQEARELLAELESALLELDQKPDDREVVGRAFRALHTIKGSGAMFGFEDIAAFAHHLETAFDRLRKGELRATADLIALSLAAGDQIAQMLDEGAGGGAADPSRSAAIVADLARLVGLAPAVPAGSTPVAPSAPAPTGPARDWHVRFAPGPGVLRNGTNPVLLLRELGDLGEVKVALDTSAVPALFEIDPERCYLAWDLFLHTVAPLEAVRDVFIFVEDDCRLDVNALAPDAAPALPPAPARLPAAASSIGVSAGNLDELINRAQSAGSQSLPAAASSIRVSAGKLDDLVNLVGELVSVQARLSEAAARRDDPDIVEISEAVERLTADLRETSMSIRMLPLRGTFERFRRLVHDLSIELHKEVGLTIEGAETELDKTVIDQLSDPLVHLIRNSMDHGIETPDARRAAGKRPAGTIHLSARHSGAHVLIQVSDDGRGLDIDAVRARALEQGLIASGARLTEAEIFSMILAPGFSTAREVTGVSGRGVGMDVVRRNIEALRGSIEISSRPGEGLTVTLRLPLTLAIIDGLLVRVGDAHFVLPLANSLECVELTRRDIQEAHGRHIANVRGRLIPYIRLGEYFRMDTPRPEREQIMIVETEHGHYGFVVDQVIGDHQTVIKNLGRLYRNVQVVSGATILGNGAVALILDPHRLVQSAIRHNNSNPAARTESGWQNHSSNKEDKSNGK